MTLVTRDTFTSKIREMSTVVYLRQANIGIMSCRSAEVIGVLIDGATVHECLTTYDRGEGVANLSLGATVKLLGSNACDVFPPMQPHGRYARAVCSCARF